MTSTPRRSSSRERARFLFGATLPALALGASPGQAAPHVTSASYLGGSGDENVVAAAIMSDGTYIVAGTLSADFASVTPHNVGAGGPGFVACLDGSGQKIVWLTRLEQEVRDLRINAADELFVLTSSKVLKLGSNGSSLLGTSADLGGGTALSVAGDTVGVIANGNVFALSAIDLSTRWQKPVGRSRVAGVAVDGNGGVFVGGDNNTNTGQEPYRSPYVLHYDKSGAQDSKLFDWAGPDVRNGVMLQADSRVDLLRVDPLGQLWFGGGSDGGNTVFVHGAHDLKSDQPALANACYSGPCFNYKGAKHTGMLARIKADFSDLERASWYIPYYNPSSGGVVNQPCGCKGPPLSPNTLVVSDIAFSSDVVALVGNAAARIPETADAWYPKGDGSAYFALLDRDLKTATFSTTIPGTAGGVSQNLPRVALRGGRLLLVGNAIAPETPEPGAVFPDVNFPATMGALQTTYAGGKTDGFVLIACVGTDAECAGPVPPLAGNGGGAVGGSASTGGAASTTGGAPTAGAASTGGASNDGAGTPGAGATGTAGSSSNVAGSSAGSPSSSSEASCGCRSASRSSRSTSGSLLGLLVLLAGCWRRRALRP